MAPAKLPQGIFFSMLYFVTVPDPVAGVSLQEGRKKLRLVRPSCHLSTRESKTALTVRVRRAGRLRPSPLATHTASSVWPSRAVCTLRWSPWRTKWNHMGEPDRKSEPGNPAAALQTVEWMEGRTDRPLAAAAAAALELNLARRCRPALHPASILSEGFPAVAAAPRSG